jgi:hypothetical protein
MNFGFTSTPPFEQGRLPIRMPEPPPQACVLLTRGLHAAVEPLAAEARVEEVARMLGGERITETARQHAREMLKQSLRT